MCGTHVGGVKAIEGLIGAGYKFDAFVCLTPKQAKKYNVSGYFDYREIAVKHDIPIYIPKAYDLNDQTDIKFFIDGKFDLVIPGGWQRLFPSKILSTLSIGSLGLHGSPDLLPKGRGRSPMNWSLIEGKCRFIMHLFLMNPDIDDGDIIEIQDFDITEFDDIETMYFKYGLVYKQLLLKKLPAILKGSFSTIQQKGVPSFYPKRNAEDGLIDWEELDIWQIYNFVRAQTRPYPGAFAKIGENLIRIWKCRPFDTRIRFDGAMYGTVVEKFSGKLLIQCRGGLLLVDDWEKIKE